MRVQGRLATSMRPVPAQSSAPSSNATLSSWSHPDSLPLLPASASWCTVGYGLAAIPLIGAAVPLALGTGTESSIVAALMVSLAVLALWLGQLLLSGRVELIRTPLNAPAFLVGLVWVSSCIASNAFFDPRVAVSLGAAFTMVQFASVTVTLASLGLLIVAVNIGRDLRYTRFAVWSFVGVGMLAIGGFYSGREASLSFLSTRGLFGCWVVALAYGQALFNRELPLWARGGLLLMVLAFVYKAMILQTGWLSGWMPMMVAVATITLLRSRALFVPGCLVALAWSIAFRGDIYQAVFQSNLDEGSGSRLDLWAQAWELLSQHPVLGTGPAGYAAFYMTFYVGSDSSMSTHSNYMDVLAQTGLVGGAAFLWLMAALGAVVWQACRRWRYGFNGGFAAAVAGGLLGAYVAMALGDWVLPFVYNQGINGFRYTVQTWVFVGLAGGLASAPAERTGQ